MIRFCTAASVSAAVILLAPFVGQIRAVLRSAFPAQFVTIVGGAVAATIGIAVLVALARVRERRALRYAAIAGALALGVAYSAALSTGTPEVDAVERVHFVEYGLVAFLFYVTAWKENRILEEFFAPVLNTPSYVAAAGHRWHPDQREDAARRGATHVARYVSDAEPRPILTWPKPLFWAVTAAVMMLIALPCLLLDRRTSPERANAALHLLL
jgi:hypothetical protein